jgi:hypothetical protein
MADTTSLHLRLPNSLYRRLQRQAKRNNASLNTEIVNQLAGAEAATVRRILEIAQPLLQEMRWRAGIETVEYVLQLMAEFAQEFAASEHQPPTEEDLRLRHRMNEVMGRFRQGLFERRRDEASKGVRSPIEEPSTEEGPRLRHHLLAAIRPDLAQMERNGFIPVTPPAKEPEKK